MQFERNLYKLGAYLVKSIGIPLAIQIEKGHVWPHDEMPLDLAEREKEVLGASFFPSFILLLLLLLFAFQAVVVCLDRVCLVAVWFVYMFLLRAALKLGSS